MSSFVTIISKPLGVSEADLERISFRHWAVVISPTRDFQNSLILYEITATLGDPWWRPKAEVRVREQGQELTSYLRLFQIERPGGMTTLSVSQITEQAKAINAKFPYYNLVTNNCQHFAIRLISAIVEKTSETVPDGLPDTPDVFKGTNDYLSELGMPDVEEGLNIWALQAYKEEDKSHDSQVDRGA